MRKLQVTSAKHLIATHDILEKYRQLGGLLSPLGLSINEELVAQDNPAIKPTSPDGFIANFRGGRIKISTPGEIAVAEQTKNVKIFFVGLECRIRQEKSDEILGTVGVIIPSTKSSTPHHFPEGKEFFDMGEDGSRIVKLEQLIYEGVPADIILNCILVEHDSGDIEKYKQKAAEALEKGIKAGITLIGVPAEATAADQGFIGDISVGIVNALSSVLGADDDLFTPQALRIPAKDILVGFGVKSGEIKGIPFPFPDRPPLERSDTPGIKLEHNLDPVTVSGVDQGGDVGNYGFYFKIELETFIKTL
jgi:hypothetical protein